MTEIERMEDERDRLEEECDSIQHQIDMAKARALDGDYSDPQWFQKARHALRCKRREYNSLLRKLGERKKAERRGFNNTVERKFVEICKVRLNDELFREIMSEANEEAEVTRSAQVN